MSDKTAGIVFCTLEAAAIISGAYFFLLAGITISNFMTINTLSLIKKMITIDFGLFLISASFALAFILFIGKRYEFKQAMLFSLIGLIAGLGASAFLFPDLMPFLLPMFALVIGVPFGSKYISTKEKELKYLAGVRAGSAAAGRMVIVACIAFFIYLAVFSYSSQQQLEQNFVPELVSTTVGDGPVMSDQFDEQLAGAMIKQQQNMLDQVIVLQPLKNLQAKDDPDALALASQLAAIKTNLSSPTVKDRIVSQLKSQKINIGEEIIKKFPMITTMAKYSWIIYSLTALILTMFIGNLIIKNLAALIYWLIGKVLAKKSQNDTE